MSSPMCPLSATGEHSLLPTGICSCGYAPLAQNGTRWWCPTCKAFVAPRSIIYEEHHETCGSDCRSLPHPDDAAVDRFAATMKWKLAKKRAEGRGGWDNPAVCSIDDLARMLVTHVAKSDPIDIANFAMMLWNRGETERGTFFGDAKTAVARSIKMAFLEGTVGKDRGDE